MHLTLSLLSFAPERADALDVPVIEDTVCLAYLLELEIINVPLYQFIDCYTTRTHARTHAIVLIDILSYLQCIRIGIADSRYHRCGRIIVFLILQIVVGIVAVVAIVYIAIIDVGIGIVYI